MSRSDELDRHELGALLHAWLRWDSYLGGRGIPDLASTEPRRGRRTASAAETVAPQRDPALGVVASVAERGSFDPSITHAAASEAPAGAAPWLPGLDEVPQAERPAREPLPERPRGLPMAERLVRLQELAEQSARCERCRLAAGRTRPVFARGSPAARLVFVGEGPGYHEDQQGEPFVGPAGQLLDKMIAAMGLTRDEVYICNVVKCRPPKNRTPLPDEVASCSPWLVGQLEAIGPEWIVALGKSAALALGCAPPGSGPWRGRWGNWRGIPVMPTFHPAFLLRSPEHKKTVWGDLKEVMARMKQSQAPGTGSS
ncbi:MAG: uracil-DNA glycosylase [Myxococcota bacterium]|nr:uracil-DNA glycosylase [Myxococcota bacterium]